MYMHTCTPTQKPPKPFHYTQPLPNHVTKPARTCGGFVCLGGGSVGQEEEGGEEANEVKEEVCAKCGITQPACLVKFDGMFEDCGLTEYKHDELGWGLFCADCISDDCGNVSQEEEDDEESPPPPATEVTQEEEGGEEVTRFVKFTFTQEVFVRVPPNTDPHNVRFRDEEGFTTAHVVDDHQNKVFEIDRGDVSTRYPPDENFGLSPDY